jgi:uncharacterized peroxidase-related enzyme
MAWIRVIDQLEASGKLAKAYAKVAAVRGRVANIIKVHSVHPEAMTAHLALYRELMFGRSELTRRERELIAVAVSVVNHCHYWVKHHGEALRALTKDEDLLAALENDPATAPLDGRGRALVDYVLKLTSSPEAVSEADLSLLRNAGLSDSAIHDAVAVAAYFNFVNRVALGLGVNLEKAEAEMGSKMC